jgi:hypothetical protein
MTEKAFGEKYKKSEKNRRKKRKKRKMEKNLIKKTILGS